MGQDTAEALKQVEQRRAALEADLATLLDRLPPGAKIASTAAAGTGGVAVLGILKKVLSRRSEQRKEIKELEREAKIQARAIAAAFAHAHVPSVPTAALVPGGSRPGQAAVAPASVESSADTEDDDEDGTSALLVFLALAAVGGVIAAVRKQQQPDADDIWIEREDPATGAGTAAARGDALPPDARSTLAGTGSTPTSTSPTSTSPTSTSTSAEDDED